MFVKVKDRTGKTLLVADTFYENNLKNSKEYELVEEKTQTNNKSDINYVQSKRIDNKQGKKTN